MLTWRLMHFLLCKVRDVIKIMISTGLPCQGFLIQTEGKIKQWYTTSWNVLFFALTSTSLKVLKRKVLFPGSIKEYLSNSWSTPHLSFLVFAKACLLCGFPFSREEEQVTSNKKLFLKAVTINHIKKQLSAWECFFHPQICKPEQTQLH